MLMFDQQFEAHFVIVC